MEGDTEGLTDAEGERLADGLILELPFHPLSKPPYG
jgi:hypothetical protein